MPFLFSCVALLLAALAVERVRLDRSRHGVPLRIAVTGTTTGRRGRVQPFLV